MGWSFSVALPADPAPCRDAAETLRDVARAAETAAEFLAGQAVVPHADFSGTAADSYRSASAELGADSAGVARDTHLLAAALDDYAIRVAAVRRVLTRVRDDAVAHGFGVTPDDRVEWIPAPGTDLDETYRMLESRAVGARAEADAAYAEWSRSVQAHTTGSLPALPVVPAPTVVATPDQTSPTVDRPDRTTHTATPIEAATAVGPSVESPTREAAAQPARRTPAEPGVDFEPAPMPVRWQPNPQLLAPPRCPTATEGAPP